MRKIQSLLVATVGLVLSSGAQAFEQTHLNTVLGGENCSNCNLKEADLSGKNLEGLFLSMADLTGANLSGARLSKTCLFGASVSNANLQNAVMVGLEATANTFMPTSFAG